MLVNKQKIEEISLYSGIKPLNLLSLGLPKIHFRATDNRPSICAYRNVARFV